MRLNISKMAQCELDEIFSYWALNAGLEVADRMMDRLEENFALLADFPLMGRKCEEIRPGLFSFPVGKYLVYYRKTRGNLTILHVFHTARDQRHAFTKGT